MLGMLIKSKHSAKTEVKDGSSRVSKCHGPHEYICA